MKSDLIKFAIGSLASLVTYLIFNYMSNFVKASEFSSYKIQEEKYKSQSIEKLTKMSKDIEYIKKKVDKL